MKLWKVWFECILSLRQGFSRYRTFLWFIVAVVSTTIRIDHNGITSYIRTHWLKESCYQAALHFFHSPAVKLQKLTLCWIRLCLRKFPGIVRINGRIALVGDGFKVAKEGKKMPAVKSLHQSSDNNSKAPFIMGHSWQLLSLLITAGYQFFAVPLTARIHEGVIFTNRDKRTLIDKFLMLINDLIHDHSFYLVVDSYYACKTMALGLISQGQHLITKLRSNAVAYHQPVKPKKKSRGRPKKYGAKILLKTLFLSLDKFTQAGSPIYGENNITLYYYAIDLLWRPLTKMVRIVAVIHPTRGKCLLMTTDCTLPPLEIIKSYSLRFKIEVSIKQLLLILGGATYRFWMKMMTPIKRRQGNQHIHLKSKKYRDKVKVKIMAYEIFMQTTAIALGLLQFLSFTMKSTIWEKYNGWMRTMNTKLYPSESIVAYVLRNSYFDFLLNLPIFNFWRKFIVKKMDFSRCPEKRLAS